MPTPHNEFTSPLMARLHQARTDEKQMSIIVDAKKEELKAAKAAHELSQGELALAVDALLEVEAGPSLFDKFATGPDPGPNPDVSPGGSRVTIEVQAETVSGPIPLAIPAAPEWKSLICENEIEGATETFETLAAAKIETMGQLAESLLNGEQFGLTIDVIDELKEIIEQYSAADPSPIRFDMASHSPTEDKPSANQPAEPQREQFSSDRTGNWEHRLACAAITHPGNEHDTKLRTLIANYRNLCEFGKPEPVWGEWSELTVEVKQVTDTKTADTDGKTLATYAVDCVYIPHYWENEDMLQLWSPHISATDYLEHRIKRENGQIPMGLPIQEYIRIFAQQQFEEFYKDKDTKPAKKRGRKPTAAKDGGQ